MSIFFLNLQFYLFQLGVVEYLMNKMLNKYYIKCIIYYLNKYCKFCFFDMFIGLFIEVFIILISFKYFVCSLLDLFWLNVFGLDVLW